MCLRVRFSRSCPADQEEQHVEDNTAAEEECTAFELHVDHRTPESTCGACPSQPIVIPPLTRTTLSL